MPNLLQWVKFFKRVMRVSCASELFKWVAQVHGFVHWLTFLNLKISEFILSYLVFYNLFKQYKKEKKQKKGQTGIWVIGASFNLVLDLMM